MFNTSNPWVHLHNSISLVLYRIKLSIYVNKSYVPTGQQQKLEGEAAYRLGLIIEKTGDGAAALSVGDRKRLNLKITFTFLTVMLLICCEIPY